MKHGLFVNPNVPNKNLNKTNQTNNKLEQNVPPRLQKPSLASILFISSPPIIGGLEIKRMKRKPLRLNQVNILTASLESNKKKSFHLYHISSPERHVLSCLDKRSMSYSNISHQIQQMLTLQMFLLQVRQCFLMLTLS